MTLTEQIAETLAAIQPLDQKSIEAARQRQNSLTKPPGSLGRLEELSLRLAGISRQERPQINHKAIVVMAGDHGVAAEGVSAYPSEVTPQMVLNFLAGGAAVNVLARQVGARVIVADLGVAADLPPHPDLIIRKVGYGTRNLAQGPAMTRQEMQQAVVAGIEIAQAEVKKGLDLVATGDMGIGNTTPSSAIVAVFTGKPVQDVTGRGTGLDDSGLAKKVAVIERALRVNQPDPTDPQDVLTKVGGFEIAGLVGLIFGVASSGIPIVVDGFVSTAAALVATEWCPAVQPYLIAAHSSVEIGHRVMLEHMELSPLLNLNLRLGEGTGAALAMNVVEAAARILTEMATFAEAGVQETADPEPGKVT